MILQINQLNKVFAKHSVLNGINLQIKDHERIALIGFNGAGKTTLIRCLLGEYLYQGQIQIFGKEPRTFRNEILKEIGFVPQLPPPLKMTVKDLFAFASGVSESDPAEMEKVAKYLGLDLDRALNQAFNRLSGGQKQKVLISIALGRKTKLLILDEPAANLDPEARHLFYDLLEKKKTETAMIISSHRIDEVASLVTRVVELDKGKIVLDDYVTGGDHLGKLFNVNISITEKAESVINTFTSWSLKSDSQMLHWNGQVSGPDRLRFLGVVSRYSGLITKVELHECPK